jgi:hypothetical protein
MIPKKLKILKFELHNFMNFMELQTITFLRFIYKKLASTSFSYFCKVIYCDDLEKGFLQPCQKLHNFVTKTQGIVEVNKTTIVLCTNLNN